MVDSNLSDGFDLYTAEHIDLDCEKKYALDVGETATTTVAGAISHESKDASWAVKTKTTAGYTIGTDWNETVGGNKSVTVTGAYSRTCNGETITNLADDSWVTVGAESGMSIGATFEISIAATAEIGLAAAFDLSIGAKIDIELALAFELSVAAKITAGFGAELKLHGAAEVETWGAFKAELGLGPSVSANAILSVAVGTGDVTAHGGPTVAVAPVSLSV